MQAVAESDWKKFTKHRVTALERFSRRILEECQAICQDESRTAHERYLDLYRLIHERDKEMADAFNDFRRSTTELCLLLMVRLDLLTAEELAEFSPKLQDNIQYWR